ncbi:NADase-type glycan-binding domain-containing protein [Thermospira aquatica]|uniref:NAD glycohydrolase translocation F5/8 type C domain-containing protein n=2 Tax=Thermospira aquatica TaxID=2828656 RepID=A0AAX3BCI1_9SPIR|nr:hypothetical protein [Thermospira aquatica]URA09904.1 hypothetical protein KDW03_10530 [Thermospira aquatica]
MTKKVLGIMVLSFVGLYAGSLKVSIVSRASSYLNGDIRYSVFSLFDGDIKTCWAENVEGDGSGPERPMTWDNSGLFVIDRNGAGEYVNVGFNPKSSPFLIDTIRIYNGYGKSEEIWKKNNRVKGLSLLFLYLVVKNNETNVITTNREVLLSDSGWNEISLHELKVNPTNIDAVKFTILSTYPGTHYNDTCISEIEFWYKGKKYEIANLEEAKREYLRRYIEERRKGSKGLYNSELSTLSEENYEKLMKAVGWEVEKDREKRTFLVEFAENGEIILEWLNWAGEGSEAFRKHPRGVAGYWKIDENGSLWIKIGDNPWKKEMLNDYTILKGTDLEGLALSDWDECGESWEGEE